MSRKQLQFPIVLSIAAALVTLAMKTIAYWWTDSVSLLSDALESVINLLASLTAFFSLRYAARPADVSHTYGHEKIEFFSSGLEGVLILTAGLGIGWYAIQRIIHPVPLQELGLGTAMALASSLINGIVAQILLYQGRKHGSIILEADGQHLMTDVWTSVAVVAGLGIVAITDWPILDPIIALVVAGNILFTAYDLIRRSFHGLMDHALPPNEQEQIRQAIRETLPPNAAFHALRTRRAGSSSFADFHLLVPGEMRVLEAHQLADRIEIAIMAKIPGMGVTIHIEPIEERGSWQDSFLVPIEERDANERSAIDRRSQ